MLANMCFYANVPGAVFNLTTDNLCWPHIQNKNIVQVLKFFFSSVKHPIFQSTQKTQVVSKAWFPEYLKEKIEYLTSPVWFCAQ